METEEVEHIEQIETEEHHETEFNVIPVQLVESYEGVALASPSNTTNLTLVKGKYYKQTYRPAWEQMPDFKGAIFFGLYPCYITECPALYRVLL